MSGTLKGGLMFISKAEKEKANKVEKCLAEIGLDEEAAKHFDISYIISEINSQKLATEEELCVEQDSSAKGELMEVLELLDRSLETITSGWASYLMRIAAKEYAKDKDSSRLMELPVVKALLEVLRKGYSEENIGKVYIKPDPARADRIFASINPFYAAYIQAVKDTRLPGMEGARAKFCLYQMNMLGDGFEKNMKNAYDYLLQAAEDGLPDANFYLARMYQIGYANFNIEKDPARAYEYYKRASLCFAPLNNNFFSDEGRKMASAGHPIAQYECSRREFSLKNIDFCAEVAKIAAEGDNGDMRRYYKAAREISLYNDFKEFYDGFTSIEKEIRTTASKQEKKEYLELLQSNFNEFLEKLEKYNGTFTKEEKAAIEEIRQRVGK